MGDALYLDRQVLPRHGWVRGYFERQQLDSVFGDTFEVVEIQTDFT
jgi:hypothetical protein